MKTATLIFALLLFGAALPAAAQIHEFPVEHDHAWRSCRGTLTITPEHIEYKTENKEHARKWAYAELQQIKVASPAALELTGYEDRRLMLGRDRVFAFKLLEGEITPEISALLMEQAARPLVTSVLPTSAGTPRFAAPVKHLHATGGCAGTLKIYPDRITFEATDKPGHSRFWRFPDIQSFSQPTRYRFEIISFEGQLGGEGRGFNFQLKEELPAAAYDYVWARVYPSKFNREDSLARPAQDRTPKNGAAVRP
jgi:hypothetical protein